MILERLAVPEIVKIVPARFGDDRGYFSEVFKDAWFRENVADVGFVQDNQSMSATKGTVRGLHFQLKPFAQGKLVRCVRGAIFDVAVDIRSGSPTFGKWVGAELSDANGEQLWTALQQDIGSLDEGAHRVSLATDSDGNVFLAGKSRSVSGDFDILAVKYAANGERLWERTHGGSGADDAKDVAVDDDGNVFIVGVMSSVPGSTEFTTLKYNPAGALQWSAAYRRDESGENQPYAVGVDPGGNVIVSGRSIVSGSTTYALSTIKYSADGVQLWLANDPEEAFPDQLNAMTTDASGNIYLAGHRFNGSNFDFHMVKYDANGAFLWAKSHNAVA